MSLQRGLFEQGQLVVQNLCVTARFTASLIVKIQPESTNVIRKCTVKDYSAFFLRLSTLSHFSIAFLCNGNESYKIIERIIIVGYSILVPIAVLSELPDVWDDGDQQCVAAAVPSQSCQFHRLVGQ